MPSGFRGRESNIRTYLRWTIEDCYRKGVDKEDSIYILLKGIYSISSGGGLHSRSKFRDRGWRGRPCPRELGISGAMGQMSHRAPRPTTARTSASSIGGAICCTALAWAVRVLRDSGLLSRICSGELSRLDAIKTLRNLFRRVSRGSGLLCAICCTELSSFGRPRPAVCPPLARPASTRFSASARTAAYTP